MERLRVSATDIDAFRRYRGREDGDLSELLAQLRRETPPTEAMRAGTALHAALEASGAAEYLALAAEGYTFILDVAAEISLPALREMKATRDYEIDGCLMTLVGKVDAIHGRTVTDHKFTSRFDAERFLNSYQWRVYLEVFDADEFRWNVFEGREIAPRRYRIDAVHPLVTHRYPGMGEDVRRELAAFLDLARVHLPERIERPVDEPVEPGGFPIRASVLTHERIA